MKPQETGVFYFGHLVKAMQASGNFKRPRLRAAAWHFAVSASLFVGLVSLLLLAWYPGIFFANAGGWQGIRIIAGVDVVLGPLLTFIVFYRNKPVRELVTDIGLIVSVQLIALLCGVYTLYSQRPVAVVFLEDSFLTVPAQAFYDQHYALENLAAFGDDKPPLILAKKPTDQDQLKNMLALIKQNQLPPHYQTQLYQPLAHYFP